MPFVGSSITAVSEVIEARDVVAPPHFGRAGELRLERNAGEGRSLRRVASGRSDRHRCVLLSARLEEYRRVVLLCRWFVGTRYRRRRGTGRSIGKRERFRAFPAWGSVHEKDDGSVPNHDRVLDQTTSVLGRGGPRQPAHSRDEEHGTSDVDSDTLGVVAERRQRGHVGELDLKVDERALAAGRPKRRETAAGAGEDG